MARKALILLILVMVSCGIASADNYAILISAGKATSNDAFCNSEYWNDLYLIYEYLLLEEHYDSTKVYVFYGDGIDYDNPSGRYKKERHNWGLITDFDNSYSTLFTIIPSLNNVITEEDNLLFYWVVGHGSKIDPYDDDSYQAHVSNNPSNPNDPNAFSICKIDLMSLINSITHYNKRKILWMTCYSGAMGVGSINPNNNKTTLISSSGPNEASYSHANYDGGNYYYHSDFNYALFILSTGKFPSETICNLNQYCSGMSLADSLLSFNELYSGIRSFINYNYGSIQQHPFIVDNGFISDRIFIGEEKKLKNVTINNNKSYWLDRIELSDVTFGSNTNTSIDIDVQSIIKKNIFVPVGSTLIIK